MYRRLAVIVWAFGFGVTPLVGQVDAPGYQIKVIVSYRDTGQPAGQMMVRLLSMTGADVAAASTESTGQILFPNIRPGTYSVKVSGPGIEDTSARFDMISGIHTHVELVRVTRLLPTRQSSNKGLVPAVALNVPSDAQKEADKGLAALNRSDFKEAGNHFKKATEIYPQFAAAYHGLGVAELRSGNSQAAHACFDKAISLNNRYTAAYLDLSRLYYAENKYGDAETLLDKANAAEPGNPEILTMLARVELLNGKPDEAITNAHRVHDMPGHQRYAIVHFVAGKAFESKGDPQQAITEYRAFLKEAPDAPNADRVRAALQSLEKPAQ